VTVEGHGIASELDDGTRLAVDRTRMAHERTLMAWVRTSTSMIGFGFTIYKFFLEFPAREEHTGLIGTFLNARNFSLILIVVALITLAMVAFENHREMQAMRARYGDIPRSNAVKVAAFVAGFGLFALAAVVLGP
jgi:putative membrane protein